MCKAYSEGGMRCSSHAREALSKALKTYVTSDSATTSPDEKKAMLDNIARKRFEYATTPEGKAEAEQQIAEQEARAAAEKQALGDNPSFSAVYAGQENTTLRTMKDTQRKADQLREQQVAARDRHREVQSGQIGEHTAQALAEEQSKRPEHTSVEDSNGTWHRSTVIGAIAVDEPFSTREHYETAAWSRTHEVKPGVYPVRLTDRGDLAWGYDTTVTDQNMPPLLGGVAQGAGSKDDIGKDDHVSEQCYAFSASSAYTPGLKFGGGSLVLREGVTVQRDLAVRDGQVSSTLTRFKIENAVTAEPQYNEYRRRRHA